MAKQKKEVLKPQLKKPKITIKESILRLENLLVLEANNKKAADSLKRTIEALKKRSKEI